MDPRGKQVVFTGADKGVQGEEVQYFQRYRESLRMSVH
jgi:DMSO/TMAO reductase YedYZ molybdopterin-dependent catalytic subunit